MLAELQINEIVGCDRSQVYNIFRCGSRVYGCARPDSDEDFVVVIDKPGAKQDLIFGSNVNIIVHTVGSFQDALTNHNMMALECYFSDESHQLRGGRIHYGFSLDRKKLAHQSCMKSLSDYQKAWKTFPDEPDQAKKKLYHSVRVLLFARQILQCGRICDYGEANSIWEEIETRPGSWEAFEDVTVLREGLNIEVHQTANPDPRKTLKAKIDIDLRSSSASVKLVEK